MPGSTIASSVCSKLIETAAHSCQPIAAATPIAPAPASPNWDAIAVSLTSQSNAISFGSAVLAVIFAVAGFAWGRIITRNAEREARNMAKGCAEAYIADWLAKEAPGIIRERVDLILDVTLGNGSDADAADEIGKEA